MELHKTDNLADDLADADLMRLLASGKLSALGDLVRRHQDTVRAFAYRMTRRWDLADDIAQEAFLRVYRSAANYRPTAAFRTWLYRIVVNLCLDRVKAARPLALAEDPDLPAGQSADQILALEEQAAAVHRAIDALPERQRTALILHRFENLSHSQIAQSTGWSESAVESLLSRAYTELRQKLMNWDPR